MPIAQCSCGAKYTVKEEHLGRTVKCKKCGKSFSLATIEGGGHDRADENTQQPKDNISHSKGKQCVHCNHELPNGAVVCVRCGANQMTGERLNTRIGSEPVSPPLETSGVEKSSTPFWRLLPGAFAFPLKSKEGSLTLVVISLVSLGALFGASQLAKEAAAVAAAVGGDQGTAVTEFLLLTWWIYLPPLCYFLVFCYRAGHETSYGSKSPSLQPVPVGIDNFAEFLEEIILPLGRLLAIWIVSRLPMLAIAPLQDTDAIAQGGVAQLVSDSLMRLVQGPATPLEWGLAAVGLVYFWMALSLVMASNSLRSANPLVVVKAIVVTHYNSALLIFTIVVIALAIPYAVIPLMQLMPDDFWLRAAVLIHAGLFLTVVQVRLAGLFFYSQAKALNEVMDQAISP